ncbi:NAD(P)H-binding protein [Arenibacter sp. 6A1]|uniref:NAD(P)H-binding protein n=1 Tax=Arenibacter sp. 6A1 TaxID=2720391 RepID=UPI0014482C41|nr:NAD(P)H-binding protein [Arenibacter sp. 6A1]NKI26532.1 NAD(P)H-binding protein [Arenibacter sp. 6A1]
MKIHDKTAIVLGATGLTGSFLVKELLDDPRYAKVKLFSRSKIGFLHPKLEEHLGDVLDLKSFKTYFLADEVFCCIGTTKAKTPDKDLYHQIDYGIPVKAAQLCMENGITTFIVISALGANPTSKVFYNKTKGVMEEEVMKCKIKKTHILQPSLIGGKRDEKRFGEWFAKQLLKIFNFALIGPWQKYKTIRPEAIATTMAWLANNKYHKIYIESDEIKAIDKDCKG